MNRSIATLAALAAFAALLTAPAGAQDFPRAGNPSIPNGVSAPFIGEWAVGFPEDEGTIVSSVLVSCDDPIIIEAVADTQMSLSRISDIEPPVIVELLAFSERTTWLPTHGGLSSIAVWIDEDSFYRYEVDAMGKADWDWPFLHRRCV